MNEATSALDCHQTVSLVKIPKTIQHFDAILYTYTLDALIQPSTSFTITVRIPPCSAIACKTDIGDRDFRIVCDMCMRDDPCVHMLEGCVCGSNKVCEQTFIVRSLLSDVRGKGTKTTRI